MKKVLMIAFLFMVIYSCSDRDSVSSGSPVKPIQNDNPKIVPPKSNETQVKIQAKLQDAEVYIFSSSGSYQGKINNDNKVKVSIPYTEGSGNYEEIKIKGNATDEGDSKNLILKIVGGNFATSGSGFLEGYIEVEGGGEYVVKQLSGGKKELLSSFIIQTKSGESKVALKAVGVVLDKCFDKTTKECWGYGENIKEHQFVYLPIKGPDGKIWLNNNLGVEYSKVSSSNFNPLKQAESSTDPLAYGSLFQWQRPSDGHELIDWTSSTTGTPKYDTPSSDLSNSSDWRAIHNKFIKTWQISSVDTTVKILSNKDLWQAKGKNNPCPEGFHVPTHSEWQALHKAITRKEVMLKLTSSGSRSYSDATLNNQGNIGYFWSSNQYSTTNNSWIMRFYRGRFNPNASSNWSDGIAVRCLKD